MKENISVHTPDIESLNEIGGTGEGIEEKRNEYLKAEKVETFENPAQIFRKFLIN